MSTAAAKIIGITEDITTCDCCGRQGLARTVELELVDGDHVWYGTTCAAKAFFTGLKGADVARSAAARCCCGCGEFGTVGTASGRLFARPCWEKARREAAA